MRLIFSAAKTCPACGVEVESMEVDHLRGQFIIWPCRHVVDISGVS